MRRLVRVALVVGVSILVYFVVTLVQVWLTGRDESFTKGNQNVDAIIVLGAAQYDGRPSPQLEARLEHALSLWRRDPGALLVVTGGKQEGDRFTEAESSRRYFLDNGVRSDAIVVEPRGRSTVESLESVAHDLTQRDATTVVVVSDPYHVLRARLVAGEVGLRAYSSATRVGVVQGVAALRRNVREAVGVMVGRISGFRRLDDWLH